MINYTLLRSTININKILIKSETILYGLIYANPRRRRLTHIFCET